MRKRQRIVRLGHVITLMAGSVVCSSHSVGVSQKLPSSPNKTSPPVSKIETFQLVSKVFDNTRTLRVLVPPGYYKAENATKRYPVFYFTDGIIVFRNIEEGVSTLIEKGELPPVIIVGIDNGGSTDKTTNPARDRATEFLPYPDVGFGPDHLYAPDPPHPQGKLYPRFLLQDVMPSIRQRYRIKSGASHTGLGGFSYGGVAALYTVLRQPGIVGKLLLESTPLWIGPDKQLLKDAQQLKQWPEAVYLGVGTKETSDEAINQQGQHDLEQLRALIAAQAPKTRLQIVKEENAKHESAAWRRRLPPALQFLFGSRTR